MLKNLRLVMKVGLLPVVAGLGFVIILVVSQTMNRWSNRQLDLIETGYAPALEMSRTLEQTMIELQRTLQDAVNAMDMRRLDGADDLRLKMLGQVDTLRSNPVSSAEDLDQLEVDFEAYYSLARRNSRRMIDRETGGDLSASLQQMSASYNAIRETLDALTTTHRAGIALGFAAASRANDINGFTTIVVTLVALTALIAISAVIMRGLRQSLGEVVRGIRRMGEGDFSQQIPVMSGDEMGDLAGHANNMMDRLRGVLGGVLKASETVAHAADELASSATQMQQGAESQSASSEQTSSAMVEMASQIDQVARSAGDLAVTADQSSSSITQMGQSINQVAHHSEVLVSSVEETASTIDEMAASINSIADKVRVVEEVSRSAAETVSDAGAELEDVITGIGKSGDDIGKIIGIIEEIADQTNLLALNAAIEAARAGEVGRGFAVVADEIRRLAERSVDSTREIAQFVESVQSDTSHAVTLTKDVLEKIVTSVGRTRDLVAGVHESSQEQNRGVQQIITTTGNMLSITQELAGAAREQAAGAGSIMEAVTSMNERTQQVADATEEQKRGGDQVVKSIEEITAVARQNLAASTQLSGTTDALVREADTLRELSGAFAI